MDSSVGKIKWLIGIVTACLSLFSLFWFLLYSTTLSNFSSIINLRNWYQNMVWGTVSLVSFNKPTANDYPQLYTFQVQKWSDTNLYRFRGTFVKTDAATNTIYLLGNDGNTYVFRISNEFVANQDEFEFKNSNYFPNQTKLILIIYLLQKIVKSIFIGMIIAHYLKSFQIIRKMLKFL